MEQDKPFNKIGGIFAREKKGPLWHFLPANDGSFRAPEAEYVSRLYFPLMNNFGMKCSITPELKGDIASAFQHYLTAATVTEELHRNISGRNFWVTVEGKKPWSATGNSAFQKAEKWTDEKDESEVEGRIGAFITRRKNRTTGLACEITVFVPETDDFVELMKVTLENISREPVTITPVSATPVFGRHPDNFRDHRQVTTMFQKVYPEDHGIRVKPTIVHDEQGHSVNQMNYVVLGFEENGEKPCEIWYRMTDFIGEGGSMDNPEAVFRNLSAPQLETGQADGYEAIGAMRYSTKTLLPGKKTAYIILHGITDNEADLQRWKIKFGTVAQFDQTLADTLGYWQKTTRAVTFDTGDSDFSNWSRWVTFQLKCRQVFGNSYLPDFGYGRGGRGWRDLWQDLISIFLIDPTGAREEILNNFKGIRIDGSNATIIGSKPGQFVADRNNVPRAWCDHGAWPVFVVNFYLNQTGDYDILFEQMSYWKDQHIFRSRKKDEAWAANQGSRQLNFSGTEYDGSLFEHLLIQQLSAFYHVGDHNNLLLEGADWNDTLDMAREKGESVCFHSFYSYNLVTLVEILKTLADQGRKDLQLLREMDLLLDRIPGNDPVNYNSPEEKRCRLSDYFGLVAHRVSGEKKSFRIVDLIHDLKVKADHMADHIRKNEWINTKDGFEFFNGHYSNLGQRVHGDHPLGVRIDLTSQVVPVMCDVANESQVAALWKSVNHFLKDENSDGLRLCTDFRTLDLNIGRITGFVYGNKEHGSKWMQQNIMLAYGLYKRGFIKEGYEILQQVYRLAVDSQTALIFPGIPSYFNRDNRGAYAYLTGSSSWLLLTMLTQVFGIRGRKGDLEIHPALRCGQFSREGRATAELKFAGKEIRVYLFNPDLLDFSEYIIESATVSGKPLDLPGKKTNHLVIPRNAILNLPDGQPVEIEIFLARSE